MNTHALINTLVLSLCLVVFLILLWHHRRYSTRTSSLHVEPLHDPSVIATNSLREDEAKLIRNIRDFEEGIVREVMVPRIDMVAIEETASLQDFRLLALEKGHSRIPVYRKTVDHVIGIAYIKDLLRYWNDGENTVRVADLMRPPYFVPETKNIPALLHEFQTHKVHIAIVIDEYGGTAGIVTIEDLLEVIFGEIADEHESEKAEMIRQIEANTFEVNAKTSIDKLEEFVGDLAIEQQEFDTVGGLLLAIFGDVPKEGDVVIHRHVKFTILHANKQRILQVKVEREPAPDSSQSLPLS
ncbi:CBS domain containing protein [Candidatus Moduliflexus flocculans]|uniref:CBS domain containing protein n=1 Tax=Candidatus Moduliflexus flocculans TaxID=1499966 RepID=A0A0S6VQF6_9BACT|nr:CBS domain containing protein [Candidatus Moduliflexus flocculans]